MTVFGTSYSEAYDLLYSAKDYDRECDVITALAGVTQPIRFLDLGCGTGGHAIRLAGKGHHVTGVDRSPGMLDIARQKSDDAGVSSLVEFVESDLRNLSLDRSCDAALMMFAVLGYQQTDADVHAALAAAAKHLRSGAPFIFDIWYGPAVLADPPGARRREIETAEGKIVRTTDSVMDRNQNLCTVNFTLERFVGDEAAEVVREQHVMRYFFPDELARFAEATGFRCERISDFNSVDRPADVSSWNAISLFRKC